MHVNENSALVAAKELTIVAMQNNMINLGDTAELTAKNVTDFFFATANALAGKEEKADKS